MTMSPRLATFLVFVVNGAVVGTWVAAIPGIKTDLGATATEMGLVLFCAALGALISQQVTGQLLVRVSSRRMVMAAGLVFPLLTVLPMLAPDPLVLAGVMIVFGAFNTAMDVSMNAHGVALETQGGTSIFSGLHAGWSLGGIIGAVGVGVAVSLGVDVVVEALLASLLLWLVVLVAGRSLGQGSLRTEGASGIHLPARAVLPICLLIILLAFVEGGLTDWGGIYLRQGIGTSGEVAAFAYAALSLGLFLGRVGGDWVKDRVGSIRLIQWGMLLTAAAITAFLVVGSAVVALVGMVVAGDRRRQRHPAALRRGRAHHARRAIAIGSLHVPDPDLHGRAAAHRPDLGLGWHLDGHGTLRRGLGRGGCRRASRPVGGDQSPVRGRRGRGAMQGPARPTDGGSGLARDGQQPCTGEVRIEGEGGLDAMEAHEREAGPVDEADADVVRLSIGCHGQGVECGIDGQDVDDRQQVIDQVQGGLATEPPRDQRQRLHDHVGVSRQLARPGDPRTSAGQPRGSRRPRRGARRGPRYRRRRSLAEGVCQVAVVLRADVHVPRPETADRLQGTTHGSPGRGAPDRRAPPRRG